MTGIQHFSEIRAWQEARQLVKVIYAVTAGGAVARDFVMRDQLRSAALSVMSNIAEGFTRRAPNDFARFLDMSRASAAEVQSLLYASEDSGLLPVEDCESLRHRCESVSRMIAGMQAYLRSGIHEPATEYHP